MLYILIVYNIKDMKKRAIKFLWKKQEVTPVKTVLESPGFLCILLSDERI